MTTTKVNLANTVEGILPVANGGTGTSTGVAPGGSTTQVQYNNAGAFAGSSSFVFDGTNIGVGVTPSAWSTSDFTISQYGAYGVYFGSYKGNSTPNLFLGTNSYFNGSTWKYTTTDEAGRYQIGNDGSHQWSNAASGTAGADITWLERMRITSTGVMYLGPLATNFSFTNGSVVDISGSGTGLAGNGTNLTLGVWNGPMVFQAGNNGSALTERMRIDTSGNVLIGSTSIGSAATINLAIGTPASTSGGITLWAGTTSSHGINFGDGTSGADQYRGSVEYAHNGNSMRFYTDGAERIRITSAGDLVVGDTTSGGYAISARKVNDNCLMRLTAVTAGGAGIDLVNAGGSEVSYINGSGNNVLTFRTAGTERFRIGSAGQLGIGGATYGSSGQVLTSQGSGSAPSWTTLSGGVTSVSAGTGISLSASTGAVTITNSSPNQLTTTTGSPAYYGSRAWVNFNGTGTVAIRGSVNVSSISDNGTGDYSVNFSTAMPDANYAVGAGISFDNNGSSNGTYAYVYNLATGSFRTQTRGYFGGLTAGQLNDSLTVTFVVSR